MTELNEPKTWDDVTCFDDIVNEAEREVLAQLPITLVPNCPKLKKEGEFFYYCAKDIGEITDDTPSPGHPIYRSKVSLAELQLFCINSEDDGVSFKPRYEKCCFYTGQLKR